MFFRLLLFPVVLSFGPCLAEASSLPVRPRTAVIRSFPCLKCHIPGERTVLRKEGVPAHPAIRLEHAPELKTCGDCHDPGKWNGLSLLTGGQVAFDQAPLVCGQCHGLVKRDWDVGLHGKTSGGWDGRGQRLSCVECHDPHRPKFPEMKAKSKPVQPRFGIPKEE